MEIILIVVVLVIAYLLFKNLQGSKTLKEVGTELQLGSKLRQGKIIMEAADTLDSGKMKSGVEMINGIKDLDI